MRLTPTGVAGWYGADLKGRGLSTDEVNTD
jgi:hypothetical protein